MLGNRALSGEAKSPSVFLSWKDGTVLDGSIEGCDRIQEKLVVEDSCLAVREDHPLLEVVNAPASHEAHQGSRFSRRGNGGVPRITFAIACFSEDLRGPSLWSSQSRVLCQQSEIHAGRE